MAGRHPLRALALYPEELQLLIEDELEQLTFTQDPLTGGLVKAMRYSLLAGGKRIRPVLALATARAIGRDEREMLPLAAAIELIHTYSLVHDDLPAMDDAALRRGRPTVHKLFGDANAILAGDALQALAFEVLGRDDWPATPDQRVDLVRGLARAAGPAGMCGGQTLDLEAEHQPLDEPGIVRLQALKTGALIAFSADAGCVLGRASPAQRRAVRTYAEALGLAFQIRDDLLDEEGDTAAIGKDAGRDAAAGKATFVSLLGREGAEARLRDLRGQALESLAEFGTEQKLLKDLYEFVATRTS